jgi:GntR family transcriptional regulator / MocR family aminotransferase
LVSAIYIGTISKTLAPAVRIGFMIAPKNFIEEAVSIRRSIDFQGDSILEIAIAELYKNGIIPNHIKKVVKIYRQRRDYFCALLEKNLGRYVSFKIPDGGLSVWTQFKGTSLEKVTRIAARKRLMLYDGTIYNTRNSRNATRLGFSSLDFSEQEEAVNILERCIHESSAADLEKRAGR